MKTQLVKLSDALKIHDEGGIVLLQDEEILHRLHEYKRVTNPLEVGCKLEFDDQYTKAVLPITHPCIIVTGT